MYLINSTPNQKKKFLEVRYFQAFPLKIEPFLGITFLSIPALHFDMNRIIQITKIQMVIVVTVIIKN